MANATTTVLKSTELSAPRVGLNSVVDIFFLMFMTFFESSCQ